LFLYYLFHHLFLYFLFFFFNFPCICSLYLFFFYSFFFYFLLQPMLILTGLSWCHKFQLHFMSLLPQIKGTFIKIERFKMNPCRFRKWMQLNMGGLRLNTLFLYYLLHHLFLYFLLFLFIFPSFCSLYLLFFYSFFFYFLLQPMLILTGLSWCHKFHVPHASNKGNVHQDWAF